MQALAELLATPILRPFVDVAVDAAVVLLPSRVFVLRRVLPSVDALVLTTVVAKCMGPIDGWKASLAPVAAQNYNMVHFTPVQVGWWWMGSKKKAGGWGKWEAERWVPLTIVCRPTESVCLLFVCVLVLFDLASKTAPFAGGK